MPEGRERARRLAHAVSGGVLLIGLAVLFHFNAFWPWILALIGIMVIIEALVAVYFED